MSFSRYGAYKQQIVQIASIVCDHEFINFKVHLSYLRRADLRDWLNKDQLERGRIIKKRSINGDTDSSKPSQTNDPDGQSLIQVYSCFQKLNIS